MLTFTPWAGTELAAFPPTPTAGHSDSGLLSLGMNRPQDAHSEWPRLSPVGKRRQDARTQPEKGRDASGTMLQASKAAGRVTLNITGHPGQGAPSKEQTTGKLENIFP